MSASAAGTANPSSGFLLSVPLTMMLKIMAIYALSDSETDFVDRNTAKDLREYEISYYNLFPEQIENALFADHRSDIYSFGASIYHMLTGRPPFMARTPLEFFNAIRKDSHTPISAFRPDVPQVIIHMVDKCLAKTPDQRYQNVGDMIVVIEQFLRTEFDSRQTAS